MSDLNGISLSDPTDASQESAAPGWIRDIKARTYGFGMLEHTAAGVHAGITFLYQKAQSEDYTIPSSELGYLYTVSNSAPVTFTLPAISGNIKSGTYYAITKRNAINSITVVPTGTDTINDAAALTISNQYSVLLFLSDGTSKWTVLNVSGLAPTLPITRVYKSANQQIISTASLVNDSELYFAIGAGETWIFRLFAMFQCGTAAYSYWWYHQFGFSLPTGLTSNFKWNFFAPGVSQEPNNGWYQKGGIILGNNYIDGSTYPGQPWCVKIEGSLINGSTAGNVIFQWAQKGTYGTLNCLAGSYLVAERLA